jgi:hypothetical protein
VLAEHVAVNSEEKVRAKVTIDQFTKAQRGDGFTALIFNPGARCRWMVNVTPRPL